MSIYFSELCLLGGNVFSNVDQMIAAGAKSVELMLDGPGWDRFDLQMDSLAEGLLARPVTYSVHTPVWDTNLTSENYFIREGAMKSLQYSIVLAAKIHSKHVVIHPGFCMSSCFHRETAKKRSEEALRELIAFNRNYGMRLLIENVGDRNTSLFTQEEYAQFLDGAPSDVGYLVDIGHAHLNGWDIPKLLSNVKDRLYAVHIHDNDGKSDQHLPARQGTVDWKPVLSALHSVGHTVNLVLEYKSGTSLRKLADDGVTLEQLLTEIRP